MSRLKVPYGTTTQLTTAVVQEREVVFDTTLDRLAYGDGSAAAGVPVAKLSEITTLPSTSNASAAEVTATGSTEGRSLADRAADEFHVLDYTAVPDGATAAQTAIIAAISAANSRGGGTVVIGGDSRGNTFSVSASIYKVLTSKITIDFRGGAKIVASAGLDDPVFDLVGSATDVAAPVAGTSVLFINPDIDCTDGDASTPGTQMCTAINLDYLETAGILYGNLYGGEDPDNTNADSGVTTVTCGVFNAYGTKIRGFNDAGVYINGNNTVGADGDGTISRLTDCTIQRCNNAVTFKREAALLVMNGGLVQECNGGIIPAEITTPSYVGPGRRMEINGVTFKKVTSNMVRFRGPTIGSVRGCTFEDWGYDYDGTGSVGANAYAVVLQGSRDVDFVGNTFRLVDWTRDDQRAYSFANITLNSTLYTHGNCRFANNTYRGIARITVWTDTGEAHHFTDEYLEDISGTKFDTGTENTATTIEYEEYGQVGRRVWKNSTTYAFTDQALALCDDTSYQDMCATLGTWKVHAISGAANARNSVNGAGDATEQTHATITIPANSIGANGAIRITALWSCTNSANAKTVFSRLGGTTITNTTMTNLATLSIQRTLINANATNAQVGFTANNGNSFTTTTGTTLSLTKDTTGALDITLTSAWAGATSAETITLLGYIVEIVKAA